ncbi:hypothetical protein COCC4DRAFT_57513 [Bipolaris maydis ATCC 48331]|uniref:Uncharacterized protein n=2 Tax=Cochliobolus heterostrophus TaxID=5016 RepID=M2TYU0_COCH5|nr:uncharacterized protein COCC4DRAFT_57513 [Bipolaris maydis ATCC 48331]EMD91459.1 hypothetical protein COCHEDRAFT_1155830 [Bipolaris maydis C5]ENI08783.1 hypothetical protein COCC4DRAFT_57513 [Bipolaris maydis ATCC 48331]
MTVSAPDTSFYTISHKYIEQSTIAYETPFSPTARKALPACSSKYTKPHLVISCPVDKLQSSQSHIRYPKPSRFSSRPRLIQPIPRQTHTPRHLGGVYTFFSQGSHATFVRPTIAIRIAHIQSEIAVCNLSACAFCMQEISWR